MRRRREYLSGSGAEQRVARNRACFRSINNLSAKAGLVRAGGNPAENLNNEISDYENNGRVSSEFNSSTIFPLDTQ